MAVRCPNCKKEFDVTLFEFNRTIMCTCGKTFGLQHKEISGELSHAVRDEEGKIIKIRKLADKIAFLIVSTDHPEIDIEIEKEKFREEIAELFPDKAYLYELIYEPRFRRLKEQFRGKDLRSS